MYHSRTRGGRCKFCKLFNCQVAHSLKPSKLRQAFERIEDTVAGWTEAERADVIIVGGPKKEQA